MRTWQVTYAPDLNSRGETVVKAKTYTTAIVEFLCRFPKGYIVVECVEVINNESASS